MKTLRIRFKGTACAACAGKVEEEIKKEPGVNDAAISIMTGLIKVVLDDPACEQAVKDKLVELFAKYEPGTSLQV